MTASDARTPTTSLTFATSEADARAVKAVLDHHAQLRGRMAALSGDVVAAAASTTTPAHVDARCESARDSLVRFAREDVVPHAEAEEGTLYEAASHVPAAGLLVEAMRAEHRLLRDLIADVGSAGSAVGAAAGAHALSTLFGAHVDKENDLILPLLAASPGVSVATLLEGMHALIGDAPTPKRQEPAAEPATTEGATGAPSSGCGCGGHDDDAVPELDVRAVPHAIRHATVFGAFDAIAPGSPLDLVAPHDPVPLLRQLTERAGGELDITYLDRGPEAWRLRIRRR